MVSGVGCVAASSASVGALELIFKIGFGSSIFRFLVDFGRFLEANLERKIDFWEVFFGVFFERDFGIDFSSPSVCGVARF